MPTTPSPSPIPPHATAHVPTVKKSNMSSGNVNPTAALSSHLAHGKHAATPAANIGRKSASLARILKGPQSLLAASTNDCLRCTSCRRRDAFTCAASSCESMATTPDFHLTTADQLQGRGRPAFGGRPPIPRPWQLHPHVRWPSTLHVADSIMHAFLIDGTKHGTAGRFEKGVRE